jgi:hypothetical protein
MKKRSLVFGMIVALAAALVFTGCEALQGVDGAAGADANQQQKNELAAYGFTFSTPVHTQQARNSVYANYVILNTDISTSTILVDDWTTVSYGDTSVKFKVGTGVGTNGATVKTNFDTALSGRLAGITTTVVDYNTAGTPGKFLKLSVSNPTGGIYVGGSVFSGSSNYVSGAGDEWELRVLTAGDTYGGLNNKSSKATVVTLDGFPLYLPAGTSASEIAAEIAGLNIFFDYSVVASGSALTFSFNGAASSFGKRPSIGATDKFDQWGYFLEVAHIQTGEATVNDTNTPAAAKVTGLAAPTATGAGDALKITYTETQSYQGQNYTWTDYYYTVFPGAVTIDATNAGIINTPGGLIPYIDAGGKLVLVRDDGYVDFWSNPPNVTLVSNPSYDNVTIAVEGTATAKLFGTASFTPAVAPNGKAGQADQWIIAVHGSFAPGNTDNPVADSKVTVSGTGLTATVIKYINANASAYQAYTIANDIATALSGKFSDTDYSANAYPGGIFISKNTGVGETFGLADLAAAISLP